MPVLFPVGPRPSKRKLEILKEIIDVGAVTKPSVQWSVITLSSSSTELARMAIAAFTTTHRGL